MRSYIFQSERLGFRNWEDRDLPGFIEMNADPGVMEYFPTVRTAAQSREGMVHLQAYFSRWGFTFYAVDRLDSQEWIGFIGLKGINFEASFTPGVEIGWRLQKKHWGCGFATEGALACLKYGFEVLSLDRIWSFTAVPNKRSERVMKKIGMLKIGEFDHPKLEKGHWLERHVLYRVDHPGQQLKNNTI